MTGPTETAGVGRIPLGRVAAERLRSSAWLARTLSTPAALGLVVIAFSIASDRFLTVNNLLTILNQAAVVGILAMGMTFVLLLAGIDVSVGATATLTTVLLSSLLLDLGAPLGVAMGVVLLAGCAIGLFNGLVVVAAGVPPIIATLGTLTIVQGLAQYLSDGQTTFLGEYRLLIDLGQGYVGRVPVPGIIFISLAVVFQLLLSGTAVCRRLRAIGSNREASRLMGLAVSRYTVAVYVFSGLIAAFAGIIVAGQLSGATPNAGLDLMLPAIAAAVLGGTSLFGGTGSIGGTFVGALLLAAVFNGLILLGFSAFYQQVATGMILVLAVALNEALRRRS